jgi:predicted PurR-regulated permease PerM
VREVFKMSSSEAIIPLVTQALNDIYSKIENVTALIENYTNKIQKFTEFFSENITNMIHTVVELTNTVRSERTKTIQHLNESTTNILAEIRKIQEINIEQMREETVKAHKATLGNVQDAIWSVQMLILLNRFLDAVQYLQAEIDAQIKSQQQKYEEQEQETRW